MNTYYIVFETDNSQHWRIRITKNDLETVEGLLKEIQRFEEEFGRAVCFRYWKKMKPTMFERISKIFTLKG